MKYLILGDGWLGNRLKEYIRDEALVSKERFGFADVNLGDAEVIINTIAKTNIDWCEKHKLDAVLTNVMLATKIAQECKEQGKKYVFFSSGCVFESNDLDDIKYEDSIPNPGCFYTETKVMAEKLIQEINPDALILRPRLPISEYPHPRNTIDKILNYAILNINQESVTIVEDMFPVMMDLIERNEKGIFHLANQGTISAAEIGDVFGHSFATCTKREQDERLASEGRAKRVTTYLGSRRIPLLPPIRERIKTIAERYNARRNK